MNTFSVFAVHCRKSSLVTFSCDARLFVVLFSAVCLLCMPVVAIAQTQLGADIDGEAAEDQIGRSVSLSHDGHRLAAGATYNNDNGHYSGHVRVYQWSGTAWVQLGADIDGEAADDTSGSSVSLSSDGNRVAIGASGNDGNGEDSGHVRVYQWSGTAWTQLGSDIDGEAAGDRSRNVSLSSDGNLVAIGAPRNDGNGDGSGHVRVYHWSGADWIQLGSDIDGEAAGDWFGGSVSLSYDGHRLAAGATFNDGNGYRSGHVRVYQWSGTAWEQLDSDIDGKAEQDSSGSSVSLSSDGSRLAIGASGNDDNGTDSGHVRVYQWVDTAWTRLGADINGEAVNDYCCGAVSLSSSGNRLAIASAENDGNGDMAGHVRIYQWSGTDWNQIGVDIDGEAAGDYFGESLSLSPDGNRVAAGARWNGGNGFSSGHVRAYDLSMFNTFRINPGLNDAWYDPNTDGQGFFITVFPDLGAVSLAWFTYDTELPPMDATANLGDAGHRWLTAVGPIVDNQSVMEIEMTSAGLFDTFTEITRTDPPGSDGTIILTFEGCNSATVEYDIPSINRQGVVPIRRVATDNIVLCEALKAD